MRYGYANPLDMNIVNAIALSIAADGMTIKDACEKHGITYNQLTHWRRTYKTVAEILELAKEDKFEALLDEIVTLAENSPRTPGAVAWTKMQIWAREKAAQMLLPAKYKTANVDLTSGGDKLEPAKIVNVDTKIEALISLAMARREQGLALPAPTVEELMG